MFPNTNGIGRVAETSIRFEKKKKRKKQKKLGFLTRLHQAVPSHKAMTSPLVAWFAISPPQARKCPRGSIFLDDVAFPLLREKHSLPN
jgi:hypothetical protein